MNDAPKSRIRLKFARLAPAKDLSHLEQIKALRARAAASGTLFGGAGGWRLSPRRNNEGRAKRGQNKGSNESGFHEVSVNSGC